jgi:hypothetical protein
MYNPAFPESPERNFASVRERAANSAIFSALAADCCGLFTDDEDVSLEDP